MSIIQCDTVPNVPPCDLGSLALQLASYTQKSKSMAVGGIGMVCTANYNARKFGVRAAMPGFIARRLCPDLVFVKPDFQKYTTASQATRAIFRMFDPDFEAGSLDEAYLDLTDYCNQHGMTGVLMPPTVIQATLTQASS